VTEFDEQQQDGIRAFTERTLGQLADSLTMLLGQQTSAQPGAAAMLEAEPLEAQLPDQASGVQVTLAESDAPILFLLETPLVKSLTHLAAAGAADELDTLRSDDAPPSQEHLDQLNAAAAFFVSAAAESWPAGDAGAEAQVVVRRDGSWAGDDGPIAEGSWLRIDAGLRLADSWEDPLTVLIPQTIAATLIPELRGDEPDAVAASADTVAEVRGPAPADNEEPETADAGSTPTAPAHAAAPPPQEPCPVFGAPMPLACVGVETVASHAEARLDETPVQRLESVEQLRQWVESGARPTMVIARIGADATADLEALGRMKRDHELRDAPVMLLLDHPIRETVLACGRLGLVNALPSQVDPDVVWRRIASRLRRAVTA